MLITHFYIYNKSIFCNGFELCKWDVAIFIIFHFQPLFFGVTTFWTHPKIAQLIQPYLIRVMWWYMGPRIT